MTMQISRLLLIVIHLLRKIWILFSLERKFNFLTDQHDVNMMWEKYMAKSFDKFICLEENFMLLNQLEVTYQKNSKIVNDFISHEKKNVQQCFEEFKLIYQNVYNLLFPMCLKQKIYSLKQKIWIAELVKIYALL